MGLGKKIGIGLGLATALGLATTGTSNANETNLEKTVHTVNLNGTFKMKLKDFTKGISGYTAIFESDTFLSDNKEPLTIKYKHIDLEDGTIHDRMNLTIKGKTEVSRIEIIDDYKCSGKGVNEIEVFNLGMYNSWLGGIVSLNPKLKISAYAEDGTAADKSRYFEGYDDKLTNHTEGKAADEFLKERSQEYLNLKRQLKVEELEKQWNDWKEQKTANQ